MAGIGFALRKLTRRDDLLGIAQGYGHSAVTAAGPWILTIICVTSIVFFGSKSVSVDDLNSFRLIVIYNFAFSLVFSGPVVMVATRFLADAIHSKDVSAAPGLMVGGLSIVFALQAIPATLFYFFYADLPVGTRMIAAGNFYIVAGIWLVSVFLTALKDYNGITLTFGAGMATGLAASALLAPLMGITGMLLGFTCGLALILFMLIARVLSEYPYACTRPFAFGSYFRKYWELAASGLVYNLGIWIDKWIMWTAPEAVKLQSGLISYPDYDSAMFLAYITIVPSMAAFILAIETDFFEEYLRFYRDIQKHATFATIEANHKKIVESILRGARNFLILQASVCLSVILMAPQIFDMLNINFEQLGMFRIGTLGALFHVMFLGASIIISYFDKRMAMLKLQALFLVTNGVLTWVFLQFGFPFYGYGYFLSATTAFLASFIVIARFVGDLPYHTFIVDNTSAR
jgi:uncharacterized membrane protein